MKNKPAATLLMIRNRDQAADFISDLDLTNPVVYAPMVHLEPLHHTKKPPMADVIIFTSSNAVRFYGAQSYSVRPDVICVGSRTAVAAQKVGFNVLKVYETAQALIVKELKAANLKGKVLLYPRAETVSVDITQTLSDHGYSVHDFILYKQTFVPLPQTGKTLIQSQHTIVPVFSKAIAYHFRSSLEGMQPYNLVIVCISPPVADIFDGLENNHITTAQMPTRAGLIDEIRTIIK